MPATTFVTHTAQNPVDNGGDWPLYFPEVPKRFGEWAGTVTMTVNIQAVLGAPTDWKLEARTLTRVPYIGGPNSGGFQGRSRGWSPMDKATTAAACVEKVAWDGTADTIGQWATIASHTSNPELEKANFYTAPDTRLMVQRSFAGFGADLRTELRLTLTGGTTPKISLSTTCHARG